MDAVDEFNLRDAMSLDRQPVSNSLGVGDLTQTTLPNVPTLDVRQLSDAQLDAAEQVLAETEGHIG